MNMTASMLLKTPRATNEAEHPAEALQSVTACNADTAGGESDSDPAQKDSDSDKQEDDEEVRSQNHFEIGG